MKILAIRKKFNVFIKYIKSSLISFIIDIILFTIFNFLFRRTLNVYSIIAATIIARFISSMINYLINRNIVFNISNRISADKKTLIKYIALVIAQMLISSYLVLCIYRISSINETIIKIIVDMTIFIINFYIQKKFIFKK